MHASVLQWMIDERARDWVVFVYVRACRLICMECRESICFIACPAAFWKKIGAE